MFSVSPTAEGFRAAFRRPSFTLAEIAWRWTAGASAATIFLFGFFEYLDSLPVTKAELFFLRTRQPTLVAQALSHILRGSMSRAIAAGMLAALLLTLLWIVAASAGRIATVRSLLDYFRRDVARNVSARIATNPGEHAVSEAAGDVPTKSLSVRTLFRLNFLRAVVTLAAVIGVIGATIIAGFASPDSDPQPGLAFLLFLLLVAMVGLTWCAMNWFLCLAAMFAVRDGGDTLAAISTAVGFVRERTFAVFGVSLWTGLAHLVAFVGATMIVSVPLGLAGALPGRLIIVCMMLVTLAYFVVVDWLYMARLAGYVCIAETPEALLLPPPVPPAAPIVPPIATKPIQTAVDKDEPILSDIPTPVVEP